MSIFSRKALLPKSKLLIAPDTPIRLSFCITHKQREDYIKQTLEENLADNYSDSNWVEFVLMDFNEDDVIENWVKENFINHIKEGYLKYFSCRELGTWHASVAKNTSHKVAQGSVLVNLDCDNYTGKQGAKFVYDHFEENECEIVLWQFSKKRRDGSFGRIALTREMFNNLGGYDESFMPMGYQDNDLFERARAKGAKLIHKKDKDFNQAIANEKFTPKNMKYEKMRDANKASSKRNIKSGQLVANGGVYGLGNIKKMNSDGTLLDFNTL